MLVYQRVYLQLYTQMDYSQIPFVFHYYTNYISNKKLKMMIDQWIEGYIRHTTHLVNLGIR